jgi:hypothetical protein
LTIVWTMLEQMSKYPNRRNPFILPICKRNNSTHQTKCIYLVLQYFVIYWYLLFSYESSHLLLVVIYIKGDSHSPWFNF